MKAKCNVSMVGKREDMLDDSYASFLNWMKFDGVKEFYPADKEKYGSNWFYEAEELKIQGTELALLYHLNWLNVVNE